MTQKLIREGRMGPPKCWKTGSVATTYPRPLLVLELDQNGMDVVGEQTTELTPAQLAIESKKKRTEIFQGISYVDFCKLNKSELPLGWDIPPNLKTWPEFHRVTGCLLQNCPWRTVVIDSTTALQHAMMGYIAATAPQQLADARKWASTIGTKINQVITTYTGLPDSHFVIIIHEDTDKNEITGEIQTLPMIYSKFKLFTGGVLSQFFYQRMEGGKPILYTQSTGFVKGVGARWPDFAGRPKISPPTCENIYGKEMK